MHLWALSDLFTPRYIQDIDALFQDLRELHTRRETELAHELAADEMTSDYRELAQVLSDWMIEQSHELPRLLKATTVKDAEVRIVLPLICDVLVHMYNYCVLW